MRWPGSGRKVPLRCAPVARANGNSGFWARLVKANENCGFLAPLVRANRNSEIFARLVKTNGSSGFLARLVGANGNSGLQCIMGLASPGVARRHRGWQHPLAIAVRPAVGAGGRGAW